MRKKYAFRLLWNLSFIILLASVVTGVAYGADYIKVIDVAPFVENDRAYDTVRPIAETFGIYVDWEPANQQVTLTRSIYKVIMRVGSYEMTVISPVGVRTVVMDVAPVLKESRVFLPVRFWAEPFGLSVVWREDEGSVTVSEGIKALTVTPGKKEISLTGGHFLKTYDLDKSFRFYYPEGGVSGLSWEGYAEVLVVFNDEEYVITAVNSGAGRSDPIDYTSEEITLQISQNAELNNINVINLPDFLYGEPAFRVDGIVSGVPQAGLVFLQNGHLCGLTVEVKRIPSAMVGTLFSDSADALEIDIEEPGEADFGLTETIPADTDKSRLHAELAVVNTILDEIIASFVVM